MKSNSTCYYSLLAEKTGISNGREFPINPFFDELANLVKEMVYVRTDKYDGDGVPNELDRYKGKPWSDLLEVCNAHLQVHKKGISSGPYVLALIPPMYSFLSHWNKVKITKRTKQALAYLRRLISTLN